MKDLTSGNIGKNFILFSFPVLIGTLLSLAFNLIDSVVAGKMLGEAALASISSLSSLITLITCTMSGISNGACVLISKDFGEKKYKYLKFDIITTLIIVFVIDVVISFVLIVWANGIMDLMQVDTAIRLQTKLYFIVYMGGFIFIQLTNLLVSILHSVGISFFAMIVSIIGAVINLSGNILSVLMMKREYAVAGIAGFSVFSAFIVDAILFLKIVRCVKSLNIEKSRYKFKFSKIKIIFHFAGPNMLQQCIMYISTLILASIVNKLGYVATAGYAVANKLYTIIDNVYAAVSKVLSTFIAQCVGAKKYKLINKGFNINLLQCFVITLPLVLFFAVFDKQVCGMFFSKTDIGGTAHIYAADFARCFLPFVLINMFAHEVHAYLRGIIKLKWLNFMTGAGSFTRILFGIIFAATSGVLSGIYGVYAGWVICWITEGILGVIVILKYKNYDEIKSAVLKGYDV